MHGFTLKLPDDYRCHGPDIVAFSFFATAPEHNGGGNVDDAAMTNAVLDDAAPDDARYKPFWRSPGQRHPRLHRMNDILGCAYATVLLTQIEFDGPFCVPPTMKRVGLELDTRKQPRTGRQNAQGKIEWTSYNLVCPKPCWLVAGGARTGTRHKDLPQRLRDGEAFGDAPLAELADNRGLQWRPRANDPNAGKPPREEWEPDCAQSGYQSYYFFEGGEVSADSYRLHDWGENHARNHIGGTMRPVQSIPPFSAYYVEFDEEFGDYNFGTGNAQLDFRDMKFDWACG